MNAVRIQAKFVVVSSQCIFHPGQVLVRDGRIMQVSNTCDQPPDIDLNDSVLLPGFVNAHTHLEFSGLERPFHPGTAFPDWIAAVVHYRQNGSISHCPLPDHPQPIASTSSHQSSRLAIARGLQEMFMGGTAVCADIVTFPWQPDYLPSTSSFAANPNDVSRLLAVRPSVPVDAWQRHMGPVAFPRVIAFPELIGLQPERLAASCRWAEETLDKPSNPLLHSFGISPHAPYSIRFDEIKSALVNFRGHPIVAMHVAESRDERLWLSQGEGAFRNSFERLGFPIGATRPSIEDCLELLATHPRSLLIHGNYLTPAEIETVARSGSISVVFCPRTHAHFGHERYPLEAMRGAGIRVVLGTDSRASNPDLNIWDEVVSVAANYPDLTAEVLFDSITIDAAKALEIEQEFGSLRPGRLAYINVVPARKAWRTGNLLSSLAMTPTADLRLKPLSQLISPLANER